ncbi:Coenzyme F420 hydrogenase/dehydrogenase, beta subunit C-terminal domain [Shewanella sp. 1180_01]|uniref:Coenzyme F420 hydrogenase/dehydrogenase, beta subunit C-terminal domain n=1 Tax=Shewanella sp. 1180_01 TaxID=2604451 RepID=UPI0040644F25
MDVIQKVLKKDLCTGCGLCSSMFPDKIIINKLEYNRPVCSSKLNRHEQAIFKMVCPGINQASIKTNFSHPIWGPIEQCYIGHSNDKEIRYLGSSGGIVTQTLLYALDNNIVDIVIQIGVDKHNPLENISKVSRSRDDLLEATGSRYSPASPLEHFLQTLSDNPNKRIAFVGKPCDCVALRNLMSIDNNVKNAVKLVVSFFCAGTPSRFGVRKVADALNYNIDRPVENFFFRGKGWPGKTTLVQNSIATTMEYSRSWGEILGPTIQSRCKLCADGTGEVADIVSADVWHSDDRGYPLFTESDGQGLVLARSEVGKSIVTKMISENIITVDDYNIEQLSKVQVTQFERKSTILVRYLAKQLGSLTFINMPNQRALKAAKYAKLYKHLRVFVGSFLRVIKGRM